MMYRLLVISDDWHNKDTLKSGLLEHGVSVLPVTTEEVFGEKFPPDKIDLILLDCEAAQHPVSKLCHAIKRERLLTDVPLILLVTENQLPQVDFNLGIEDYLTLPISASRVAHRLNFLMWKLNRVHVKNGFSHGDLVMDFERYEVHVRGVPADLTYKEFELLKFLAMHPGRVFTREALLDKVWGYNYYGGTRTVDVHVRRLRSKIEHGGLTYIETVRNVGYKFLAPV